MQTRAELNIDASKRIRDLKEIETKLGNYMRLTEGLSAEKYVRLAQALMKISAVRQLLEFERGLKHGT